MDLIKLKIHAAFINEQASASWREAQFGSVNEFNDLSSIVDIAVEQVTTLAQLSDACWPSPVPVTMRRRTRWWIASPRTNPSQSGGQTPRPRGDVAGMAEGSWACDFRVEGSSVSDCEGA